MVKLLERNAEEPEVTREASKKQKILYQPFEDMNSGPLLKTCKFIASQKLLTISNCILLLRTNPCIQNKMVEWKYMKL